MVKRSSKKQKRSLRRNSPNINKDIPDYKGGKLNIDEICHNCSVNYYAKSARRFCKLHGKVWQRKTNSCRDKNKRSSKTKKQKGGLRRNKQNWEKNEGYFGEIMDKNGKLNGEEICHNCWPSAYAKGARRFCKLHDKVWDQKTNSCRKKKKRSSKTKKQKGGALCVPCISPILSGLGVLGAGAAATAGAMTMTRSKVVQSGDNIEREQSFEKNTSKTHKKGKKKTDKLKFYISQKNNKVSFKKNNGKLITKTFNKSKNMKTNIKRASHFYDNKIKYCVVKGYKKC